MLIETIELNLSNVGLGALDEVTLLNLFATVQSHRIMRGTGLTLRDITDQAGTPLYPGFYRTHLQVPFPSLLSKRRVWDKVAIGVDIHRYGRMVLDSTLVLADRREDLDDSPANWNLSVLPNMHGSLLFVIDSAAIERPIATPKDGSIAGDLPVLRQRPKEMDDLRRVRREGAITVGFNGHLRLRNPLVYAIEQGRDVAIGHALMFSRFTSLLDLAEHTLLNRHVWPPFSTQLLEHLHVLERELFYFGNTLANSHVQIDITGVISPSPPNWEDPESRTVPIAVLQFEASIFQQETGFLLAAARFRKLLIVPKERATLAHDAERLLHQHQTARI